MRRSLVAMPLVLLLAGCSGSDSTLPQAPAGSATVDPTATAEPTLSPTPAPEPTATPTPTPRATTASPVPAKRAADGDVDGDGEPDRVTATAELLTVTLSGTGKKVTAPVHADSPAAPEVAGSTDVDRDGHAELFLQTVQGASTSFLTPYRFDGTTLRELQLGGQPALLGYGGSTQHGDGFRCTPEGRIEVRKAEAAGDRFTVELTVYRLTATELRKVSGSTTTAAEGSPEVQAAYAADCGSVGG